MIKVIAFDLIGVLAFEKDIKLINEEAKLERMFGPNISDDEFITSAKNITEDESFIISMTKNVINKLYVVNNKDIFKKIKKDYSNIQQIIATNHISYIKEFINKSFDVNYLDDIIISSEINKIKPNNDFYQYILDKFNISPEELLFIDDNQENINSASDMNINTIKINKNDNLFEKIICYLENIEN